MTEFTALYAQAAAWLSAHHALVLYVTGGLFALANLAIKVALYYHPLADWVTLAEQNPRVAALARLMAALGIQPVAVLQSIVDFIRSKASPGTLAFARSQATSASRPLIAPPDLSATRCSCCGGVTPATPAALARARVK